MQRKYWKTIWKVDDLLVDQSWDGGLKMNLKRLGRRKEEGSCRFMETMCLRGKVPFEIVSTSGLQHCDFKILQKIVILTWFERQYLPPFKMLIVRLHYYKNRKRIN